MTTVRAVYEGGVLKPVEPLALDEGETVEVTVARGKLEGPALRPPTPEEEDYERRMNATRTLEEMFAVMDTAPPLPDGYDLCKALNENRRATGERLLFPETDGEINP